jgi:mono/diheme cytochrome c family protein
MLRVHCLLILGVFVTPSLQAADVDYQRQIKPVLRERCFACHGALKQESGLRVDTAAAMRGGGDSGPAIEPGSAAASFLLERISSEDESFRMPPEGKPLTAEQIAAIRTWIDQGAPPPEDESPEDDPRAHWAFQPPAASGSPLIRQSAIRIPCCGASIST